MRWDEEDEPESEPLPARASWDFDVPAGTFKNRVLTEMLWEQASDFRCFLHRRHPCPECYPPLPPVRRLLARVRLWWFYHRPHLHLGPCPREDE